MSRDIGADFDVHRAFAQKIISNECNKFIQNETMKSP